jgi:glyoxylase-like metal-dependent hydrolase (beta-lactamase superfamily II)
VRGGHGTPDAGGPEGASEDETWGRILEAGFHLLRIPTPFAVGRVNCWLIEDEPLTLVDTGPNSGKALDEVDKQLRALGHRITDLELIIVSHQHIDHLGLVQILAERSGAEVAAIEPLVPILEDYSKACDLDDDFATDLMRRHGIGEQTLQALRSVSQGFRAWGARADVSRTLVDGEVIELRDRKLEVQLRPGHSPTDTVFWDAHREILIGADHLIGHISSNPLLTRPINGGGERPRALLDYMASLEKTRALPAQIVLPGHGEPVTAHRELIDSRFAMHRRRADKLHRLISAEPMTAHQLAHSLWGNVAVTQAFLTLSEVIGHLDVLVQEGRAEEIEDGEVVRFAATEDGWDRGNPSGDGV